MPSIEASPKPVPPPQTVPVAVAVLVNARGEVLLTRRHRERQQGGLWEFPGGKFEAGEDVDAALRRELREELGVEVEAHEALLSVTHDYPQRRVQLHVRRVSAYRGAARPREGQPMRWVAVDELHRYTFPAANAPIVQRVREWVAARSPLAD